MNAAFDQSVAGPVCSIGILVASNFSVIGPWDCQSDGGRSLLWQFQMTAHIGQNSHLKRSRGGSFNAKSLWLSVLAFMAVLGPGFITANVDKDPGGILTYAQAVAKFG